MSVLLALTAAMAGTNFQCEVVTRNFSIFAPAEEVTASHRGNVLTLYKIDVADDGFGEGWKVGQVLDALPHDLFVSLEVEDSAPIEITIFDLDEAQGTARVSITEDLSPVPGQTTMITLEGGCTFSRTGEEAGA